MALTINILRTHYTKNIMQKYYKLTTALILFFFTAVGFAGDNPLLDLQNRYRQATFLSANFTQEKQTAFISQPLTATGNFQFAKDKGLIWAVKTPFSSRTLFAGGDVFIADDNGNWQVGDNDRINQAVADILTQLLSGNWENLDKQFTQQPTQTLANGDWSVTLSPTGMWVKKALKAITLQGNDNLKHIALTDKQDNQTTLILDDVQQQNSALTEAQLRDFTHP